MTQPTVNTLRTRAQTAMQAYADARIETHTPVKVPELKAVGFVALDGKPDGTGISRAFRSVVEGDAFRITREHNERITIRHYAPGE